MFRPRIIPVLLLKNNVLVKSIQFNHFNYIGDPFIAVRIFNELKADELVFLDIDATREKRCISIDLVKKIGEEANMPFAVGGGINTVADIRNIIGAGAERIIINSAAVLNPQFIKQACETFGSSTIIVCIDIKKNLWGNKHLCIHNGKNKTRHNPIEFALQMQQLGVGELIIQSIDKDGTMTGYDIELLNDISKNVTIPIVALGGAGNLAHLKEAFKEGHVSGLAAGSLFVYKGSNKGVLINYPERNEIDFTE
jgi:imidazole glycerol-phosphate synthase subunit HisF